MDCHAADAARNDGTLTYRRFFVCDDKKSKRFTPRNSEAMRDNKIPRRCYLFKAKRR
jgi:hypothetical protein